MRAAATRRRAEIAENERSHGSDALADTVHELRTPLTTVVAALEVLREGYATTDEERAVFYDQAHGAAQHMLFLVHDLLDAAALGAGRLRVDLQDCFVTDLLKDAVSMLLPSATARNCSIHVAPVDDCTAMRADPHRTRQVLFNLLSNALKYSPEGSEIQLGARVVGGDVHVEVVDAGIGVPLEKRHALFGRYSRVHGAGTVDAHGTGLGLALCRELVQRMHGDIGYRPRFDGPGSVFWFRLPGVGIPASRVGRKARADSAPA